MGIIITFGAVKVISVVSIFRYVRHLSFFSKHTNEDCNGALVGPYLLVKVPEFFMGPIRSFLLGQQLMLLY